MPKLEPDASASAPRRPAAKGRRTKASKRRAKGSSKKPSAKKAKKKTRPKKEHTSRAAILPSQSVDHGTPPVVAEGVIYPVLGDPVDLDPCSNADSIIRARRKVILPENGLRIPWRGRVYVNPPYGAKLIKPFIEKIIGENRHNGTEIIGLFPANMSAEWFDLVAATARAVFFWGPGEGNRRLVFIGNEEGATFASVLAYWGPNLPLFVRHAIRFCHPWYPAYDLSLTRALLGDAAGADQMGGVALADELLTLNRHDDLAAALVTLGGATLGDIMDYGRSALLHRLRSIPAYELASALLCATRPGVHWLGRRLPRTPKPVVEGQLSFPAQQPAQQPDESTDEAILRHIRASTEGLSVAELMDRLRLERGEVRGALRRLRKQEIVSMKGTTNRAKYVCSEQGKDHAAR